MKCAVTILLCVLAANCERRTFEDKVVMASDSDPEMRGAMAAARAKAAEFWRRVDNPTNGETGFSAKVPITDKNGTEYFWLTKLKRMGDRISGTVDNDPNIVKTVRSGQRIEVAQDAVVDWLYMWERKMYGNYTLRPLLKKMDPAQARQLKAIMAEP